MKNYFPNMFLAGLLPLCLACTEENAFDAAGSFEAEEILISAEANGRITALNLEEGQMLQAGQVFTVPGPYSGREPGIFCDRFQYPCGRQL